MKTYWQSDKDAIDWQLRYASEAWDAAEATSDYSLRDTILAWLKDRLAPKGRKKR